MKSAKSAKSPKTARRASREIAVQALYAWHLNKENGIAELLEPLQNQKDFVRAHRAFLETLLNGVLTNHAELKAALKPFLDRDFAALSPIESGILLLGAFELLKTPETPLPVVLNEAIELAKSFGGTDSHKYINGVLDKLAQECRAVEASARKNPR